MPLTEQQLDGFAQYLHNTRVEPGPLALDVLGVVWTPGHAELLRGHTGLYRCRLCRTWHHDYRARVPLNECYRCDDEERDFHDPLGT